MKRGLLGGREARQLTKYHGFVPWQCVTWGLQEVRAQLEALPPPAGVEERMRELVGRLGHNTADGASGGAGGATDSDGRGPLPAPQLASLLVGAVATRDAMYKEQVLADFRRCAVELRSHMGAINELQRMQVPFPYFHLINLILLANLVLVSYVTVPFASWPLSIPIVASLALFLIGMRSIALKLSNPFGTNKVRARAMYQRGRRTEPRSRPLPLVHPLVTLPSGAFPLRSTARLRHRVAHAQCL